MRALVTGGCGFIGSHLVSALLRQGWQVRILDSLVERVHGRDPNPLVPADADLVRGDVCDLDAWKLALADVQVVFHQAAYQDYMPDYSRFFGVNVVGTALLYELLRTDAFAVQKVVVASSQAVYGEGQYLCPAHGRLLPPARSRTQLNRSEWDLRCEACGAILEPVALEEPWVNPHNAYALSKLGQEMAALRLGRALAIPTVALRYSITQGPRQSPHNAYSGICRIFTQSLAAGIAPAIYEDGGQRRDYIHVDDVVAANLLVMSDSRADFQAFNVGSGAAITVADYARAIAALFPGAPAPEIVGLYREGDNRHSVSSIARLQALGWSPTRSLPEILTSYVEWFRAGQFADVSAQTQREMQSAGVVRRAQLKSES